MIMMRGKTSLVIAVAALGAGLLLLPQMMKAREAERVELRLVVRDMAFHVDGQEELNPTLRFKAGQRVRLTLVNDDIGVAHDFTVPAWDVRTPLLATRGDTAVDFIVPPKPGTHNYTCTPHSTMMRGSIEVE